MENIDANQMYKVYSQDIDGNKLDLYCQTTNEGIFLVKQIASGSDIKFTQDKNVQNLELIIDSNDMPEIEKIAKDKGFNSVDAFFSSEFAEPEGLFLFQEFLEQNNIHSKLSE